MNLIKVRYLLEVGNQKFIKLLPVQTIPPFGSILKIGNYTFTVKGLEQDLNSYQQDSLEATDCFETILAVIDPDLNRCWQYPKIIAELLSCSWIELK